MSLNDQLRLERVEMREALVEQGVKRKQVAQLELVLMRILEWKVSFIS